VGDVRADLGEAVGVLVSSARGAPPGGLIGAVRQAATRLGAAAADIYLIDYEENVLVPVEWTGEVLAVDGTVAGRAYRTGDAMIIEGGDGPGTEIWLPLIDGSDRLGALRLSFETGPTDDLLIACGHFTSVVAELVVTKNAYGDDLELVRRRQEMDLAAELRWSLLPPKTFANDDVSIAGVLEPAYQIAGDCFDYAVNPEGVHLAVIDAMGHGLEASRLANLAVISYRHSRRRDLLLPEIVKVMDDTMRDQFGPDRFATAQLARLDASTGSLQVVSAGHPPPLLVRHSKLVGEIPCDPRPPVGVGRFPAEVSELALEPGDQVVFYSDGVTEARAPDGELFGVERLGDFIVRATLAQEGPAETARRLIHSVLAHVDERLLDDATVVILGWRHEGVTRD
jgi:stage II sporulation SpoE-like protein